MSTSRIELLAQRSEKYSFQDFTNQQLTTATDLNDIVIVSSCFYQTCTADYAGDPFKHIFPKDMRGVVFVGCNLDNVYVPPGNTIRSCSHRRIKYMNDGEYWFLDEDLKPTEPIHKQKLMRLNENIDPSKIPAEMISVEDLHAKRSI